MLIVVVGCRTTSGKRANKDIIGINEQLYELEKNQITDKNRLNNLEEQVNQLTETEKNAGENQEKKELEQVYKDGYKKYLDQKYPEAIEQFAQLTNRFDDDSLIDNALYWQAESYFKSNLTEQALKYYQMIYRYFPFSNKADYALYKIGLIYQEAKEYDKALLAFNRLSNEYPGSDLFKTVTLKINEIKKQTKKRRKR
jgi:TolA-binding protein